MLTLTLSPLFLPFAVTGLLFAIEPILAMDSV